MPNANTYKRFNIELDHIFDYYKNQNTSNLEVNVKYKEKSIDVQLPNNIKMILGQHYPFHPPQVFVNEMNYIRFLHSPSARISLYLKRNNINCLCCSTIICDNNWSCSFTIIKILNEMNNTRKMKQQIKYEICLDEIIGKTGIPEIMKKEIMGYLSREP